MTAQPANPVRGRPHLSLAPLTMNDIPPVEFIDAAGLAGFQSVTLRMVAPIRSDTVAPMVGNEPLLAQMRERLDHHGMGVLNIESFLLNPDTDVSEWEAPLEIGARFGAPFGISSCNDPDTNRSADNFARLCEMASGYGIRIMLEFVPYWALTNDLGSALKLLEASGADAGILVDALHLSRSGGRAGDLAGLDPSLFSYVHLCDAWAAPPPADRLRWEGREGRRYPGEGELDLNAFLDAFPAGATIEVEAPCTEYAHLGARERAACCFKATVDVLERHAARSTRA